MISENQPKAGHRDVPANTEFREFMASGWSADDRPPAPRAEVADHAARRRAALSQRFPGERLVIPGGGLRVRSNDTDYTFRPHTAFAHLSGLGSHAEPDSVLVLEPGPEGGHHAVLYFRPPAPRDSEEFYTDSRYGEFWVGYRPTIADIESQLGLTVRHIDSFAVDLAKDGAASRLRVVRSADRKLAELVDTTRTQAGASLTGEQQEEADEELAHVLSGMRIVKDAWEVGEMRKAIAATHKGFDAIITTLPEAVRKGRGERWVEGVFGLYARHEGNGTGYESICAAGDHANTIHWTKNTGEVREGDLILVDAGIEIDSLFTADITRTLPVSGRFTDVQRKIYDAVHAAQQAGMEAVKPGNKFSDIHAAANKVIARHLHEWGLLPEGVTLEQTLDPERGGWHRRWMVHGTSHHLGMDVHDCQLLLREDYMDGELKPGMVLTVEPGLYFKADDLLAPEEFRGIGVRIEDDVLVTEDGYENLSAAMPRGSYEVEEWIAQVSGSAEDR
ncbi:aminopeptidase P family protein [Streptomyces sp. H27-H1]|uniref:aminopeptidase P family protein n=1 Tax=Streptomyces sp. H27-H1 TaxID=2996461 RepID=UPI002270B51C|nr:aminopeptidase P family protein [Streptomyces sp. H27-H1]MCY0931112.1 aminopeptidase P family protein [Streptomyces sp. H27-H1]